MSIENFFAELSEKDIKLWLEGEKLRCSAPNGALNDKLKAELSQRKSEIILFLNSYTQQADSQVEGIYIIPRTGHLPVSKSQQRLWSLNKLQPNNDVYNINTSYHLRGSLNINKLKSALNNIINRHEVFRTTFHEDNGQIYAKISEPSDIDLKANTFDLGTKQDTSTDIESSLHSKIQHVFNLSKGPLYALQLFKTADSDYILSITIHHIIYDGWSKELLTKELSSYYNQAESIVSTSPLEVQYVDYAAWHNTVFTKEKIPQQRQFWEKQLDKKTTELIIPADNLVSPQNKGINKSQQFSISNETSQQLNQLSRTENATLFITLMAAYNVLLFRYSEQEDLSICLPAACRSRSDIESTIGYFNNILVIRNNLSNNPSLKDVISQVKKTFLTSLENQDFPFHELTTFKHLTRTTLTNGMFSFRNTSEHQLKLDGLDVDEINIRKGTADFNLAMYMELKNDTLTGIIEYNSACFNDETITKFITDFQETLETFYTNPNIHLSELRMFSMSTSEIESSLKNHPKIEDAVVVPTQESFNNQNLAAYIVPNQYDIPKADEIHQYLKQQLPYFRVPHAITPIAYIPLLTNGSIDKNTLPPAVSIRKKSTHEFVAPKTSLEKELARIWKEVLWIDEEVGINDDFFELGGHSLLAAQLVAKIEDYIEKKIPANALLKISNINSFISALKDKTPSDKTIDKSHDLPELCGLPTDTYLKLLAHTSSWKGSRISKNSIITGLNTAGKEQPLFWCFQGNHEFTQLSKYLGLDQPVYAMRSGHLVMEKSQENINTLAGYYVHEILQIQETGPFLIGGNCQSAQISFQVAKQLTDLGHRITLLCLQEQFVPFPYQGRVAFFYGDDSSRNPLHYFNQPEAGWKKFYTGEFNVHTIPGGHGNFFREPNIQVLSKKLSQEITLAKALPYTTANVKPTKAKTSCLPSKAYHVVFSTTNKIYASPGETITLNVLIKNTSKISWAAKENHHIGLGFKWLNKRGRNILIMDPGNPIKEGLEAGQQQSEKLTAAIPNKSGKYIFEIDLTDNDTIWFKDKGSTSKIINVTVSKLFLPLKYFRKLFSK